MTTKAKRYCHGDVLIKAVKNLPEGKREDLGKLILAEGETTGHAHRITSVATGTLDQIKMFKVGNETFVEAPVSFQVTHEEHLPIDVPAGLYRIDITKEYDHFSEEIREVAD